MDKNKIELLKNFSKFEISKIDLTQKLIDELLEENEKLKKELEKYENRKNKIFF